jgi:hypothetical protein
MSLRHISLAAVRQLHRELDPYEEQAKIEKQDPLTHSLGLLRMDLIEECRRRLMFITYMVKDAREHHHGRIGPS